MPRSRTQKSREQKSGTPPAPTEQTGLLKRLEARLQELGEVKSQMERFEARVASLELQLVRERVVGDAPEEQPRARAGGTVAGVPPSFSPDAPPSAPSAPTAAVTRPAADPSRPPLLEAAARGDQDAVRRLLEAGADADATDDDGQTALLLAAAGGHAAAMEALLEGAADASLPGPGLRSLLHVAAASGHLSAVRLLLKRKANVNAKDARGCCALHVAAAAGRTDVVAELLQGGANANSCDRAGWTALLHAAKAQHWDTVVLMVLLAEQGACAIPSSDIECAQSLACQHGHVQAVRALLNYCNLLRYYNDHGLVVCNLCDRVAECLRVAANGAVVLALANSYPQLLRKKAGEIAVCCAARDGRLSALRALLEAGVNPRAMDKNGQAALFLAAAGGHVECCKALLGAAVRPAERKLMCNEALYTAASLGKASAVRMLLQFRADANYKNIFGKSPLSVASANGHNACVKELQASGERGASDVKKEPKLCGYY